MKKPKWVVEKEQAKKAAAQETVWLFGLHAVRDALLNPNRQHLRLILTKNAADKLGDAVQQAGVEPEICDPRRFAAPLDPASVHQGAALETKPLKWGSLEDVALAPGAGAPRLILLDQVTDPSIGPLRWDAQRQVKARIGGVGTTDLYRGIFRALWQFKAYLAQSR